MKKIFFPVLLISLLIFGGYIYFEPEVVGAVTAEIDVTLTVTSEITITAPTSPVAMSQALSMTSNTATGTATPWTVKTNNVTGYTLSMKGDNANIMASPASSFTDYTEATTGTPEMPWTVSSAYEFGFSVYGADAPTATWGTDTDCTGASAHVPSTTLKYRGFSGVTAITVATSGSKTTTSGTALTQCLGVEQNGVYAPSGSYTADITGTALVQ